MASIAETYEISQMDVPLGVQQYVIGLQITMNDTLRVNILQGTTKLCHPESHRFLCEALARDMKPEIATIHEIDHNIAGEGVSDLAHTWNRMEDVHILYVLEAVSQIAKERVIEVLEHSAFANNVPDTLRADN
jgi:hypothetical protein